MPYSIVDSNYDQGYTPSQQISVFRNPRGLKYYYALIVTSSGLLLYKSADGSSWSLVATLNNATFLIASIDLYDDGTKLIVYVAYGQSTYTGYSILYRRLLIQDGSSDPTIGAEQTVVTGYNTCPVIKMDRNGYVHIFYMTRTSAKVKGVTYYYFEPRVVGTTTTNPDDAPSWCTPATIDTHPAVAYSSWDAWCSPVVFGDTGNIAGVVYVSRNSGGIIILRARNVVSFNGTVYTLGTATTIISSEVSTHVYAAVAFRVVADTSNYAHLLTERTTTNARIQSLKASAASTVESWASPVTVDNSNNACTVSKLSLSIDRTASPNKLYAFYVFDSVGTNILRLRSSPVDTISWSSENTVQDDTTALYVVKSCYQRVESGLQVVYVRNASPYTVRFYELVIMAVTGWRKLQYLSEPPTTGWNKLKYASEPPVAGAWNKLLFEGE
jgi:hypothetical protein